MLEYYGSNVKVKISFNDMGKLKKKTKTGNLIKIFNKKFISKSYEIIMGFKHMITFENDSTNNNLNINNNNLNIGGNKL